MSRLAGLSASPPVDRTAPAGPSQCRPGRHGTVTRLMATLLRGTLRLLPMTARRWILARCLWAYRRMFDVITVMVERSYDVAPKNAFPWGVRAFVFKHVEPRMTVLEIGCGNGQFTAQLAGVCREVLAYDRSPSLIREATQRFARPNLRYWVGDAAGGLPKRRVDLAVLSGVLTFVQDRHGFLRALREVTPVLLVRETRFDNCYTVLLGQELGVPKSSFVEFTKDELVRLLEETGWRVTDSWDTFDLFLKAVDAGAAP